MLSSKGEFARLGPPSAVSYQEIPIIRSYACPLWFFVSSLVACLLLIPSPLSAQSLTSGGVVGTATDPSGAAVPNATVTLKNQDPGGTGGHSYQQHRVRFRFETS
jgi:hypothetical protein